MKTQENKNIKLINKWCNAWELPGGSYLDMLNCYSKNLESFAAIQNFYAVKPGQSRNHWEEAERKIEKQYKRRKMNITSIIAKDNKAAIEGIAETEQHDGKQRKWNFAVFFVFDKETGLIIRDHTYMPDTPNIKDLKQENI